MSRRRRRCVERFSPANHPKHTKRQHAFAGLVTCALCGCALTGELKKGRYTYYHCTGYRGPCGNTYIREEELARLLGEAVRHVRIPPELADGVARVLRESQADKEKFVRATSMRLQQQQLLLRTKLDRVYDDRLGGEPFDLFAQRSETGDWLLGLAIPCFSASGRVIDPAPTIRKPQSMKVTGMSAHST